MAEFQPRAFGYAHSHAIMDALKSRAQARRSFIGAGYDFVEKPGEDDAFRDMIELAAQGGHDILYVDSVKEFAGHSLTDFKNSLTAIHKAGMLISSSAEPNYDYDTYMTAIEVLEDLTPAYRKSNQRIAAVTMHTMGADIPTICENLDLPQSEVYEAIASYKRSLEEAGIE